MAYGKIDYCKHISKQVRGWALVNEQYMTLLCLLLSGAIWCDSHPPVAIFKRLQETRNIFKVTELTVTCAPLGFTRITSAALNRS